jgi:hypothetical protein
VVRGLRGGGGGGVSSEAQVSHLPRVEAGRRVQRRVRGALGHRADNLGAQRESS